MATDKERSADLLTSAQAVHDHAIAMGAKCSAEKSAKARIGRELAKDAGVNLRVDTVSSTGRVAAGARDAVAASHLPTEGKQTPMSEVADSALIQQLHDVAASLGASCPDVGKLAHGNGIALMKMQAIRAAGGQSFGPGGRPLR